MCLWVRTIPAYRLQVSIQPDNKLAYTNHVFVHPDLFRQMYPIEKKVNTAIDSSDTKVDSVDTKSNDKLDSQQCYVCCDDGHVFIVKPHDKMGETKIGFNRLQRESCGLKDVSDETTLQTIVVTTYQVPRHRMTGDAHFDLSRAHIEFQTVPRGQRKLIFNDTQLQNVVGSAFRGHVFTVGQKFWCRFGGYTLMLEILTLGSDLIKHDNNNKVPIKPQAHTTCVNPARTTNDNITTIPPPSQVCVSMRPPC